MTLAVPSRDDLVPALRFLSGGGVASRLILDRDWTGHPLGPPEHWPEPLKVALSLILNSPESMILCWDEQELYFFFNETYVPLLGPRVSTAMGEPFRRVWADGWAQAAPIIADAFAGKSQRFTDLPWKLDTDRGPADTWFTFSYSRILGTDGEILGLFVLTNETTERVHADAALRESQAALHALNDTLERQVEERTAERDRMWNISPDLLVVMAPDGTYRRANPAWLTILGYDPSEIVGLSATALIHPDDLAAAAAALDVARTDALPDFESRIRHKDGSYRWIAWVAAPGPSEIFAMGRHVTAAREADALLRQTEEQLRQAQKMEAVGQLTGGIAHDFNNMLTGVIGSLDLLKRQIAIGKLDRADRYIDAATTSAQRAAGLTHRLLAFSRRQSLDVKAVDVEVLVAGMTDLVRRTLGENIELAVAIDADTAPALTDQHQLESALLNLAINARDAMPGGGRLTIGAANVRLDDIDIADGAGAGAGGDFVAVRVTDTGEGMSEETIHRAFEPFFTTKAIGAGTGLGLSMIYGFARQSGGHVRIASTVGEGTTVTLYLPRADHAGPTITAAPDGPAAIAQPGEQVLLVEDDPAVRMLVGDLLADLGYGVRAVGDGREALALLPAIGRLDLIVTDVGLPGIDGRQLADAVREQRPGLKVLFITGYAERAAVRGDFLGPGMEMIAKPFAIDTLAAKVREMLG